MSIPENKPTAELNDLANPVEVEPADNQGHIKPPKPSREISQASIASFFYGTLQLLFTTVGAALLIIVQQSMQAFQPTSSPDLTDLTGVGGETATQLAEMEKLLDELGITDPSAPPTDPSLIPPTDPVITPTPITSPELTGLPIEASPTEIVPTEILIVLLANGFGFLGLITAFIAFRAITKGKIGKGLALTGLFSSLLSYGLGFIVMLVI